MDQTRIHPSPGEESLIQKLVGTQVTVAAGSGWIAGRGVLEAYEHPWLQLTDKAGDSVFICVYTLWSVRPAKTRGK